MRACASPPRGGGACSAGGPRALRGAADAGTPLMAKRCAEPLLCHVPVKRLLRELPPPPPRAAAPERRPRGERASAGPAAPKRKLEEDEAPPGKRPGLRGRGPRGEQGDAGARRRGGPAAPQDERTAEGRADGGGKKRAAAAEVTERGWGGGRPPWEGCCGAAVGRARAAGLRGEKVVGGVGGG